MSGWPGGGTLPLLPLPPAAAAAATNAGACRGGAANLAPGCNRDNPLVDGLQAVVRSLPEEPNMTITLVVAGKQRNMDRWAALARDLGHMCGMLCTRRRCSAGKDSEGGWGRATNVICTCPQWPPCVPMVVMRPTTRPRPSRCALPPLASCRPKDELLEKPLARLQKSSAPPLDRQQRRAAQKGGGADAAGATPAPPPPFVGLHAGPSADTPVLDAGALTNEQAWRQGRLLRVGDARYRVELNPPLADRLEVHARPFVGIPLMPVVQVRPVPCLLPAPRVVASPVRRLHACAAAHTAMNVLQHPCVLIGLACCAGVYQPVRCRVGAAASAGPGLHPDPCSTRPPCPTAALC